MKRFVVPFQLFYTLASAVTSILFHKVNNVDLGELRIKPGHSSSIIECVSSIAHQGKKQSVVMGAVLKADACNTGNIIREKGSGNTTEVWTVVDQSPGFRESTSSGGSPSSNDSTQYNILEGKSKQNITHIYSYHTPRSKKG